MSHMRVGREGLTLDECILSLVTENMEQESFNMFNNMLANLNWCQHSCRPALPVKVTDRPVSKENTNMSYFSHLWDSYFLS